MAKQVRNATGIRRAFQNACRLYESIAGTLLDHLDKLSNSDPGRIDKKIVDAIKEHQKIVLMVLDFETQLFKRRIGAAGTGAETFDLDAARREISRRLDRLAAEARA